MKLKGFAVDYKSHRRFGVEIEVNTSDGIVKRPDAARREIPRGADNVARIVSMATKEKVKIIAWDHVHNNDHWIVKPDNSCGIEINSPILKGWLGLRKLMLVEDALKYNGIKSDNRCSLHVHVNIADLKPHELASVIAHYIKCEHVFFDSVPVSRKNNRYCQLIGMTDLFEHNFLMDHDDLISRISNTKYFSLNAYHFMRGGGFSSGNNRKQTLEFRIMEGGACLDSWSTKNWIRLLLHFVDVTRHLPVPPIYEEGNRWSSLLWLDVKDIFSMLKFDGELSPGLRQVRDWFVMRLLNNARSDLSGIWSNNGRAAAWNEISELSKIYLSQFGEWIMARDRLYGSKYVC